MADALLMSVFKFVKSFVDNLFQHLGRAIAFPVFFDNERERMFLLDLATAQDAADFGIVGLGWGADHHGPLGQSHIKAFLGRAAGEQYFAQTASSASSHRPGSWCRSVGYFNLDIEPVLGAHSHGNRELDNHHGDLRIGEKLLGFLDAGLAHLVDELLAMPRLKEGQHRCCRARRPGRPPRLSSRRG